ncbi:MAG: peptidylprolyl isomerase [Polaromonas sp.]|nr:peptidylprolyl isomerase [Polaromonas sp.]
MTKPRLPSFSRCVLSQAVAVAVLLTGAVTAVKAQSPGLRASPQMRAQQPPAAGSRANQQADYIVAVVNSEPITNSELRTKLIRTEQQMVQQGAPMPARNEMVRLVLERMITDKAQLQLARTSGIRVDDNTLEAAVQSVARQNQISMEELRKRLAADGIPYSQFQSNLRDELLVNRLRQREVEARVSVTESEIDQFLRDQQNGTDVSAQAINLAEILIPVPENATPAQVTALQARAQQVTDKARSGSDFAALATEFSSSATKSNGGEMGLRTADRYPPLFVEATQTLRVGGVARPVRSGAGFHVLKVLDKKQAGVLDAVVPQTHARHILLRLSNQQTEALAIAKLAGFKKSILAGNNDFAALARSNSEDGSAKEGGDLGWVSPGVFVPEFEKVMDTLALNQMSEPIVTRFGVHLLQVLERREAKLTPREQREAVRGQLREKKQDEAYALWLQDVRGKAYVELRDAPQ